MGVSGTVFNNGEVYYTNEAQSDKYLNSDIDVNQVIFVQNLMIGPVYVQRKDGTLDATGVVHLYNKRSA